MSWAAPRLICPLAPCEIDVNGLQPAHASQRIGHLPDAILRRVEDYRRDRWIEAGEDGLQVRERAINEDGRGELPIRTECIDGHRLSPVLH